MSRKNSTQGTLALLPAAILALTIFHCSSAVHIKAPTILSEEVARQLTYVLQKGDISCAKSNAASMETASPGFFYNVTAESERVAPRAEGRDPIPNAWEPVLEPIRGCNGLRDGWLQELSFTAVLDKSWVDYYETNQQYFSREGYTTLQSSVRMLTDRADYLYRKQFGIAIRISQVIPLPDLGEDCKNTEGFADATSSETLLALRAAGGNMRATDANLLRFGTNFADCSSYVDGSAQLCDNTGLSVIMTVPFTPDGRMKYDGPQTVAHEIAHFLGICDDETRGHCTLGHVRNEFPDIMVWEPWVHGSELRNGFLFKFLTTCTPVYRDLLCPKIRDARCARAVPPMTSGGPTLVGNYFATMYANQPLENDWHDVTVTEVADAYGMRYKWTNRAGWSWELTRRPDDPNKFDVSESCPYYRYGYTVAEVQVEEINGEEVVTGIYGPWSELYERV